MKRREKEWQYLCSTFHNPMPHLTTLGVFANLHKLAVLESSIPYHVLHIEIDTLALISLHEPNTFHCALTLFNINLLRLTKTV